MENWLPLAEVARRGNIPESTARRYARLFDDHLPHARDGRTVLYAPDCSAILARIGQMFADGRTATQVHESLKREAATIEVQRHHAAGPEVRSGVQPGEPAGVPPGIREDAPAEASRLHLAAFLRQMVDQKRELSSLRGDVSLLLEELARERRRREALENVNRKLGRAVLLLARRLARHAADGRGDAARLQADADLAARLAELEAHMRRLSGSGSQAAALLLGRLAGRERS